MKNFQMIKMAQKYLKKQDELKKLEESKSSDVGGAVTTSTNKFSSSNRQSTFAAKSN